MSADNIQVAVKARPLLKKEKDLKLSNQWKIVENSIQLNDSPSEPFYFDHIFDEVSTNQQIFDVMAKPIVDAALRGFNGTIFAYGQTSSGKTYTMVGDERNPGVMVMAVQEIFKEIDKATDRAFLLRVGYIEIYNEKIYDLLNKKNQDLKIFETGTGEVNVNCTDFITISEQEIMEHLHTGNKARKISETNMNERSSRSHAIFRIIIESRKLDKSTDETAVQISHLNLVDLAGSERADQTGATGSRLKEGCHINKSLLSLSCVINKLSENESVKFINYRDSKLTRILQASLGGNALTAIICTIKTTVSEETNSTLSFAMRAKSIKNKPHKNEVLSDAAMMKRLEKEISRLKNELEVEKSKNSKITISKIERLIEDAEHKIVHSQTTRNPLRRRTWCPSSTALPELNTKSTEGIDDNIFKYSIEAPPLPQMFMTPLITMRDHYVNSIPEENFSSSGDIQFSESDFIQADTDLRTPVKSKFCTVNKHSLTPVNDIKSRYHALEHDFEELKMFTKMEKEVLDDELNEAHAKISQYEEERCEYLECRDSSHEKDIKLEFARKRCQDLESRILELNEDVKILKSKEIDYQNKFQDYTHQLKSLQMASKDVESIKFEYENYKEISKSREQELLLEINARQQKIDKLENLPQSALHSADGNNCDISSDAFISIANNDIMKAELSAYNEKLNQKEELIYQLNSKIEDMHSQNSKLQEDFDMLSTQLMEHVYEIESLNSRCEKYEQILLDTKMSNESLAKQTQSYNQKLDEVCISLAQGNESLFVHADIDPSHLIANVVQESSNETNVNDECNFKNLSTEIDRFKQKGISIAQENHRLLSDIIVLKSTIDQQEKENSTLKSQIDSLKINLNLSSDQSLLSNVQTQNIEDIGDDIGDNNLFTSEHAAAIINDIVDQIFIEKANIESPFNIGNSSKELNLRDSRKMRYSLPSMNNFEIQSERFHPLSASETLIRELVENNKSISLKLKAAEKLNVDLADRIKLSENYRESLETELALLKPNVTQIESKNEELQNKVSRSEEYKILLEEQLADLQNKLLEVEKEKQNLLHAQDCKQLATEVNNTENSNSDNEQGSFIKQNPHALLQEKTKLEEEILQFKFDNTNLKKQLEELEANITQHRIEREIEEGKLKCSSQTTFDLQLKEKELKISELESCLISELERYNSLKQNNESLIFTITEKSKQNYEQDILVKDLKNAQNKLTEEMKVVTNERNLQKERNCELKQQLESLKESKIGLQLNINQYKDSFQGLENDNKQLKENFNTLQANMIDLQNTNKSLSEDVLRIEKENLELTENLIDLNSTISELKKSNFDLKQNEGELSLQLTSIKEIRDKLDDEIEIIRADKKTKEEELDDSQKENSQLKIELEKSRTLLKSMEDECHLMKKSMNTIADNLLQLQQERDRLLALKDGLEKDFKQKLTHESDLIQTDLTNLRSENIVITDRMESLKIEKAELKELLEKNVSFTKELEIEFKLLTEKLETSDNILKSLESTKKKMENKLSEILEKYNKMTIEKEHLGEQLSIYEEVLTDLKKKNTDLQKEQDLLVLQHKQQFEKATSKVDRMKDELENSIQQYKRYRSENDEMKLKLSLKESEICELHSRLETMLAYKESKGSNEEISQSKDQNIFLKDIELELQSLKEEHNKCENITKEKDELLKQLHEMQKMHVYKMKQYQQEIQNLKSQLSDKKPKTYCDQNYKNSKLIQEGDCYERLLESANGNILEPDEMEQQKMIKILIGENDDLRVKNQNLTVELQESRKISQKDRKSKRQSTHDEKRPLLWNEIRDIGTMTMPTDKLCNCERLNKELSELKKELLLKQCRINTILMESEYNPFKEKYEVLKKLTQESELDMKELRKEIFILKSRIVELCKESKKCDQCLQRSKTVYVNQFSQTALNNEQFNGPKPNSKVEGDYLQLVEKNEDLRRLCRMRNTQIQDLKNKLCKEKENESNNGQFGSNTAYEGTVESLSDELRILKKKYEEAKFVCTHREKRINQLETELARIRN